MSCACLKGSPTSLVGSEDDVDARDWAVRRTLLAGAGLVIVVAACGGSMTATEYIEGLNDLVSTGFADFEAASVAYDQIEEPTMAESVAFIDREIVIRRVFLDGFEALDPPEAVTEVHRAVGDAFARLLAAAEELVAVTNTVGSLEEAEQTPEFAEYRAANVDGARACLEVQAKLREISSRSIKDK